MAVLPPLLSVAAAGADAALEAAAVALGATAPVAALEPPLRKSVAYQPEPLS